MPAAIAFAKVDVSLETLYLAEERLHEAEVRIARKLQAIETLPCKLIDLVEPVDLAL